MSTNKQNNETVPKQPEYIRKIIKMWMEKEDKTQDDLQLILLCGIALDDNKLVEKLCKMGASPSAPSNPEHIWLIQQYGYLL